MNKLLTELNYITYSPELIAEANRPGSMLVLRNVILQRAEAKNQNGRVYPREILMREAKRYNEEFVAQRRALGELDHPESPVVNLKNAACNVLRMEIDGDDVRGDVQILSTPSGNIVRELIKNNIRLGISSRGMGSVRQMAGETVQVEEDYNLICFDIVSNPSTYGAFINEGVMRSNPLDVLDGLVRDFINEIRSDV
ncbi:MAG: primosomal protein [Betaproteobacteria bacterium]|jgi:hypothetical protein